MITKQYLKSCTDDQINTAMAWIEVSKTFDLKSSLTPFRITACNSYITAGPDFCNRTEKTMEIAVTTGMSIELPHKDFDNLGTITIHKKGKPNIFIDFNHEQNYLRVICEVYILSNSRNVLWA
jgi:hypothetical protein